jgi:hypothetical protein
MRKSVCLILVAAMCFSVVSFSAFAANSDADLEGIASAMSTIECVKDMYGLSTVDFDQVVYADPIIAYEYTALGPVHCLEFVPIIYNGTLIGWVTKNNLGEETLYQFTTEFVEQVNEIVGDDMEFAFIYDFNASYLYDGISLYKLSDITINVDNRTTLSNVEILEQYDIRLGDFSNVHEMPTATENTNLRTPVHYECDIDYVSQNPPSNLCWAASVACIINFLQNANYTATAIAKLCYGSPDEAVYNQTLPPGGEAALLRRFGITYTCDNVAPSGGVILRNITNDYPIFATFCYTYSYHACVIYGVNVGSGQIYVMDPQTGFEIATYSSTLGFAYTYAGGAVTLFLDGASCKYWTTT